MPSYKVRRRRIKCRLCFILGCGRPSAGPASLRRTAETHPRTPATDKFCKRSEMEGICARCGERFDDDLLIDLCEPCDTMRHRDLREAKQQNAAAEAKQIPRRPKKYRVKQEKVAATPPASPDSVLQASELLDELTFPTHEPTPSPALPSEANRQAADEWAMKARQKHELGDDAAALRFCERSLRLSDSAAARSLEAHLKLFGEGSPPAAEAARVLQAHTHLAVLGLSQTEARSTDAVKKAYKRLCLLLHPDRNHARQAEAAFKRLQSAYEALKTSTTNQQAPNPGGRSSSSGPVPSTTCKECGWRKAEADGTFDEEDGLCVACYDDLYNGSGSDVGYDDEENDEDECYECGEPGEYPGGVCQDCQESLAAERAERRRAEERRRAQYGASSSNASRCYGCSRPYKPPPSYMGNRPMCFSCRDDDLYEG